MVSGNILLKTRGRPLKNLTGRHFNRLHALGYAQNGYWVFRCDCGKIKIMRGGKVVSGNTKSCGCWYVENRVKYLSLWKLK